MQGQDEEIYNKITLYYDISENIEREILKLDDIDEQVKFDVLMPIVGVVKNLADKLTEKYILFLKDRENMELKEEIISALDEFLEYVYVYKNKLYDIYKDK
jgi:hypothetical protein